jgi:predicted nucleotidyltransferase
MNPHLSTSQEAAALEAVEWLAASCADVLRSNLVSAILHGSLTQGDFRSGKSDLDLLLVVERALTPHQADALVTVVESAALGPAAGVDLLVVTSQAAAAASDEDPARELWVGRWPGPDAELEIEGPDQHVSDNWPEFSESRANGRSLLGPEPCEVLGEVPPERVRANALGHLRRWLGLTDDARNAVLMVIIACRMWRFELTGEHVSKAAAARWALQQDPSLTGVQSALLARTTSHPVTIAPSEVERVLLRVLRDFEGDAPA